MKNLLYIGNNLKHKKTNPSYIQILGKNLEAEGFKVRYASSKKNKLLRLFDMVYSCFYHAKKTDLVLIDTYSTTNFYYAFVISQCCRLLKLAYIPILHGGNLDYRIKVSPRLSRLLFLNAKTLVSPSIFLKKKFIENGYENIIYIPNAVDIDNYQTCQLSYDKIKILWVRSFSAIYNPQLAIKVLKVLIDEKYDAKLCMVGPDSDGSLLKTKKLAEELNVEVEFTGKLTKQEWTSLANDYNIFINTTNFDNMPVSVIEAMALGLPIVSTNVGGLPYLITHEKDGLLVKPKDKIEFSNAIKRLFNNPDFAQDLASNARKKAEQFDWDIVKNKWISLFNS